jgi:hypothetical protein
MDDFDWVFLIVWVVGLVLCVAFWAAVIALGFYAVNAFS